MIKKIKNRGKLIKFTNVAKRPAIKDPDKSPSKSESTQGLVLAVYLLGSNSY